MKNEITEIGKDVIDLQIKALKKLKSSIDKSFEDAQEAFSSARAQLVRAEVFLENARIALDDTSVRSPIAGTVISRLAEVGQVIHRQPLLSEEEPYLWRWLILIKLG